MKAKIINFIKFAILLWVMVMGFFATYALVWIELGIPTGWWAGLTVAVLTIASVYGYTRWAGGNEEGTT